MLTFWLRRMGLWAGFLVGSCFTASTSSATPLSATEFASLARHCAPSVSASVLLAVASVESKLDPLALRNNTRRISIIPLSVATGGAQAKQWIAKGDSVDLGLMQINSTNLAALGLTVESALDPCHSLEGGDRILSAAYRQGASAAQRQAALLIALSRYNTGKPFTGLINGYVDHVLTAQAVEPDSTDGSTNATLAPPTWNVWAMASRAQRDSADWLVGSQDTHEFVIGAGAPISTADSKAAVEPSLKPGEPHGTRAGEYSP